MIILTNLQWLPIMFFVEYSKFYLGDIEEIHLIFHRFIFNTLEDIKDYCRTILPCGHFGKILQVVTLKYLVGFFRNADFGNKMEEIDPQRFIGSYLNTLRAMYEFFKPNSCGCRFSKILKVIPL